MRHKATTNEKDSSCEKSDLHPEQQFVVDHADRFNVVVCGRRWGKTFLAQDLALRAIEENQSVGWFSPNYKFLNESYKEIRNLIYDSVVSANTTDYRIETVGGAVIEFWTLENPDAGRSRKYDLVIIDEAGLVLELGERWREAIRATLLDTRGKAWFFGTPKPPRSIRLQDYAFYQFFRRGLDELDGWKSFHQPSVNNPLLDPEEIESMRREPGMTLRVARQEIDAEFLSESTDALWTMALIAPYRGRRSSSVEKLRTVLFLDPGNFSTADTADPTGIVIATKGLDGHYYVENDLSGAYTPNQCARLVVNASEHYGAKVYFESNQGGEFVRSAIRNVSPISVTGVPSTQGKEQRALAPLGCYEMGLVHHEFEFLDMENEMVNWNPYDTKMASPNRMDALVGALNVLMGKVSMGMTLKERVWRA